MEEEQGAAPLVAHEAPRQPDLGVEGRGGRGEEVEESEEGGEEEGEEEAQGGEEAQLARLERSRGGIEERRRRTRRE